MSLQARLSVHANMVEQDNSQPVHSKAWRHNAKRCRFATQQAIIYGLSNDESVEFIRRKYHVSCHTVLAIREQYAPDIEAAQERIKAQIEFLEGGNGVKDT